MFVPPIFLVTKFGDVMRPSSANPYTDSHDKEDLWRVGFVHGVFPDVRMNLFFETEAQAAHFSLWEICQPQTILDVLGDLPLFFYDTYKTKFFRRNIWTNTPIEFPSWRDEFVGTPGALAYLDFYFPTEAGARRFSKGRGYKPVDLLGTLPSIPSVAAANAEARAAAALVAQQAADAAAAQARTQAENDTVQALQDEANEAAILAAAGDSSGGTLGSNAATTAGESLIPSGGTTSYDGNGNFIETWTAGQNPYYPDNGGYQPGGGFLFINYTITNGGAAGYYADQSTLVVSGSTRTLTWMHHASGTFPIQNGQWTGDFFPG